MNRLRVYVDASVVGGTCDAEYAAASLALVSAMESGPVTAVGSDASIGEFLLAPAPVQEQLGGYSQCRMNG